MEIASCPVDTNVLLRWVQPVDIEYSAAKLAVKHLESAGCDLYYTSQIFAEFCNLLTRPSRNNGSGLTPTQAQERAIEIEAAIRILPDHPAIHRESRRILVIHNISGVQVHDARLAAAMRIHGVKQLLTFNTRDFARFPDLQAIHPANNP